MPVFGTFADGTAMWEFGVQILQKRMACFSARRKGFRTQTNILSVITNKAKQEAAAFHID